MLLVKYLEISNIEVDFSSCIIRHNTSKYFDDQYRDNRKEKEGRVLIQVDLFSFFRVSNINAKKPKKQGIAEAPQLFDAAKYMIAAGITLKSLYPKLFHVTCVAHLLQNCAMEIKSHFEDVDQLIAKVKAVKIKNITRQAKFSSIGYPPQPVPTR